MSDSSDTNKSGDVPVVEILNKPDFALDLIELNYGIIYVTLRGIRLFAIDINQVPFSVGQAKAIVRLLNRLVNRASLVGGIPTEQRRVPRRTAD